MFYSRWAHSSHGGALFHAYLNDTGKTVADPGVVSDFKIFCKDPEADVTFQNNIFILEILHMLDVLLESHRDNCMAEFDFGRIFLLPFTFALHYSKYGPAHIREIVQLYFRLSPAAREHHAKFFTFGNKHYDERMEEQNKAQKGIMSDRAPTENRVNISSLFLDVMVDIKKRLYSITGKKERNYHERTHKDHAGEVFLMTEYFIKNNCFQKRCNTPAIAYCFNGTSEIPQNHTSVNLYEYGQAEMKKYFCSYIANEGRRSTIPFPPGVDLKNTTVSTCKGNDNNADDSSSENSGSSSFESEQGEEDTA